MAENGARLIYHLIVYSQSEAGNYIRLPFQILIIKLNTGDYKTTSKYLITILHGLFMMIMVFDIVHIFKSLI